MRSLRQALDAVAVQGARAFLFRPRGFGEAAVWLESDEILRLRALLDTKRAA